MLRAFRSGCLLLLSSVCIVQPLASKTNRPACNTESPSPAARSIEASKHRRTNHAFHSSLAEVHYNPDTKALEVSLRVFTDDLGTALSQEYKRKLVVDESPAADSFLRQYLARHFALSDTRNARRPLVWVGKEIAVDVTWMYFEIPLPEGPAGLSLHNSLLADLFADQVNIVNLSYNGQKRTYLFKPEHTRQLLDF